jgi:2-polyprenyl-6-methoxyphenol hydroxylase-like FAD-dependent oxidoreductase
MTEVEVLIVGAGPTGLTLALWLTRLGVEVRIVDKTAEPGTTSRALAVQARTLEFYRQVGLADAVTAAGCQVGAMNLWVKAERAAHVDLHAIGKGLGPFDYMFIFPQDEHEKLLIGALDKLGVSVERRTELMGFTDDGGAVRAVLETADGTQDMCEARYLAGCDGAHSPVRKSLGIDFPGGAYSQLFYVADVQASGPAIDGNLNIDLDEADFLAIFPLKGKGRARLIGAVRGDRAAKGDALTFEDVSERAIEQLQLKIDKVNWFSTYHVHHRVARVFRKGRAFLLGDAAHIHSPAGGQGMNTGIGDSVNLAWKLAAVLVATTDRIFTLASSPGKLAQRLRASLLPHLAPGLLGLESVRKFAFRTVSQMVVNYRHGPLSAGAAGDVWGGDRLPWVELGGGRDNFDPLVSLDWQAHVYGDAPAGVTKLCAARGLPLHVFDWRPEIRKTGIKRNAVYLIRPDGYIGLADPIADPDRLIEYLDERGLSAV